LLISTCVVDLYSPWLRQLHGAFSPAAFKAIIAGMSWSAGKRHGRGRIKGFLFAIDGQHRCHKHS
jgi:hypothetical protein